jgi:hypothetical protein
MAKVRGNCLICGSLEKIIKKKDLRVYLCIDCWREWRNNEPRLSRKSSSEEPEVRIKRFLEFMDEQRKKVDRRCLKLDTKDIKDVRKRLKAEKELTFLESQKKGGAELHDQVEKSLRKLRDLGASESKIEEIREAFGEAPLSRAIKKELEYLRVQKSMGQHLHSGIEQSLRALEEHGYPKEKIEDIRRWFL